MAVPKVRPEKTHANFLQGPRSRRGRGERATDAMFHIDPRDKADGVTSFWLYGRQNLTQRTLGACLTTAMALGGLGVPSAGGGSAGGQNSPKAGATSSSAAHRSVSSPAGAASSRMPSPFKKARGTPASRQPSAFMTSLDEAAEHDDEDDIQFEPEATPEEEMAAARELVMAEFASSSLAAGLRRRLDTLLATAASRRRCGLLFDLVSTANIIRTGVPHLVGEYIYQYIATQHNDKLTVKFSFVGISDNVNCCAARDVLCRDDWLDGHYVGDTKRREFDALDNVHVFGVFPRPGTAAHFATLGGVGLPAVASTAKSGGGKPPSGKLADAATAGVVPRPSTVLAAKRRVAAASSSTMAKRITAPTTEALAELRYDSDEDDPEHVAEPERPKKVPTDVKKYIFDRREWSVFACRTPDTAAASGANGRLSTASQRASPSASVGRHRAVSATPGLRSALGRSAMGGRTAGGPRRPATRAESMGVTAVDFPPALAQAFRSLSSMA